MVRIRRLVRRPGVSHSVCCPELPFKRDDVGPTAHAHPAFESPPTEGFSGKLGHGDQHNQLRPRLLESLAEDSTAILGAGYCHSLAATREGTLFTWGDGIFGQCGHGARAAVLSPQVVAALSGVRIVAVAGGEYHSIVVDDNGTAYSFGAGEANDRGTWVGGWLGHGDYEEQPMPRPIGALYRRRVVSVAAGRHHSVLLVDGGELWTCGDGEGGKLGHGSTRSHWLPQRIHALTQRVASASAGDSHSLCVLRDGRVFGWGSGSFGIGTLAEYPARTVGTAGNYEEAPVDELLNRQAHVPLEVQLQVQLQL